MDEQGTDNNEGTIDADNVEKQIDACRMACDWDGVLSAIKRYARIFDVGAATSTYQHATLDSVRAYYWVCMGEAVYEMKRDNYHAIDCAKRALSIDPYCVEARIIMARILLENSGSALDTDIISHRNPADDIYGEVIVDLDAGSVLSEQLETFAKMDQKVLIETVASFEITLRNVLLAIIESLPVSEILPVYKEILPLMQGKSMSNSELAKRFVLIIARNLLVSVDLIDIVSKFNSYGLSEYRHWLFLDATSTRMMIHHHLADTMTSISEGIYFLNTMLPSGDLTHDPSSSSSFSFSNMPEICRNIVLSTACRLPLMERSQSLLAQSLDSFRRCVSGNSVLNHYYPANIRLGMNVEAALSMLLRAKGRHQSSLSPGGTGSTGGTGSSLPTGSAGSIGCTGWAHEDIVLDYSYASLDIQADVDNAFSLLMVAHSIMSVKVDPRSSPESGPGSGPSFPLKGIEPLRKSMLRALPLSSFEPIRYLKAGCGSTVGTLMSAIIRVRDSGDAATGKSISMLEWGMSFEIRPKVDLLYLLAGACCNGGRWEHAIELLDQCHFTLMTENKKKKKGEKNASLCVGELLTWLGAGQSPSTPLNHWLPLVDARASEICLMSLSDLQRARNYSRRCLLECYENKGLQLLINSGSDEAIVVLGKELFSIENLSRKIKDGSKSLSVDFSNLLDGLSEGEMSLLFLLGKIHSYWSRSSVIDDSERIRHLKVAVTLFDSIIQQNTKIKDENRKIEKNKNTKIISELPQNAGFGGAFSMITKSFGLNPEVKKSGTVDLDSRITGTTSGISSTSSRIVPRVTQVVLDEDKVSELSLEFAVCLAELGEISVAVKYVRDAIDSGPKGSSNGGPKGGLRGGQMGGPMGGSIGRPNGCSKGGQDNSQLLHLLSLLTSSAGDDAKIIGTAAALSKMASELYPRRNQSVTQRKIFRTQITSDAYNENERRSNYGCIYSMSSDDNGEMKIEGNVVKNKNLLENDENEIGENGEISGIGENGEIGESGGSGGNGIDLNKGRTTLNINSSGTSHLSLNKMIDSDNIASPNARLTLAMFECAACGYDISLHCVDFVVSATLADFQDITDYQHALREYTINTTAANNNKNNKTNKANQRNKNNKNNRNNENNKERNDRDRNISNSEDYDEFSDYYIEESPPIFPADQYERTDCPQTVRTIIDILVSCSRLYRRAGKVLKAKSCLEDGWRLLFLPPRGGMYGVSDILNDSEDLEAEILCEVALQSEKSAISKELLIMAISLCPDYVPALIALANMELLLLEIDSNKGNKGHRGQSEIIHTTNSDNQIKCFSRIIGEDSDGTYAQDRPYVHDRLSTCAESEAYGFAMSAVRARYLNPECWYILGRVYQAFGLFLEAGECFSTSLEVLRHDPIRPFSTVLNDIYVQPLKEAPKIGRL